MSLESLFAFRHHNQYPVVALLHYFLHESGDFLGRDGLNQGLRVSAYFGGNQSVTGHFRTPIAVLVLLFGKGLYHEFFHLIQFRFIGLLSQFAEFIADNLQSTVFLFGLYLEVCFVDQRHIGETVEASMRFLNE